MSKISAAFLFFPVCIAGSISLLSCGEKKDMQATKKQTGPKVLVAEGYVVKPESFQSEYATSGTLLPSEEVTIMPEIQGRVTSIAFTEGKAVKKGQLLARLYNEDINAQIRKLKAQRDLQQKISDRQSELLGIGGISQQDYETTTTQIQAINADIAYAEAQLRRTTILAPFSGKTGIRYVSEGAVVTPSTVITSLQQTDKLKMDFSIPEQYRGEVPNGKKIYFTVSGSQDTFAAVIAAMEPSANTSTRTIKIRATVDNSKNKLGPGAFTHISIPFDNNSDALLIPSQSVIPTNREKVVAVIREGMAALVPVKIGARTSDKVEIIQGLKAGDTILTTGIMQVKDGMPVTVKLPK
jgi:membrane fusion protein, multidrug efflux system